MRIIFTVFILLYTWQARSQSADHVYIGKDSTFFGSENIAIVKRDLGYASGPFLINSLGMIGSGIVSSIDGKESKLTAQFFGLSADPLGGNAVAFNLKFSGSTDDAFYRTRALARPTFSIAPGLFVMIEPGKWRLNEEDYKKKAKNLDIAHEVAEPIKTSYKWLHFSGNFDHGELKLFETKDSLYLKKKGLLLTKSFGLSYNILRSYNIRDYKLTGFKSSYFSLGIEWVTLSNFRNLPTIDANIQGTAVDTSGAMINLYNDLGTHYITTAKSPFMHYNETVFTMRYMLETVNGWVISTAVNYHRPSSDDDYIPAPVFKQNRYEYLGIEGGIHYSASNKAGKPIANIGVYGDYRYSNSWHGWIVSLRTSFPISR